MIPYRRIAGAATIIGVQHALLAARRVFRSVNWLSWRPVHIMDVMETIPITEAKARIAELADRVAREHDHFTITRNGRADVMLISVAEYESMQETLDILGDQDAVADLKQSREDFAAGDTYTAAQVRAELEQRRRLGSQ